MKVFFIDPFLPEMVFPGSGLFGVRRRYNGNRTSAETPCQLSLEPDSKAGSLQTDAFQTTSAVGLDIKAHESFLSFCSVS